jgi:hypothetical protein
LGQFPLRHGEKSDQTNKAVIKGFADANYRAELQGTEASDLERRRV